LVDRTGSARELFQFFGNDTIIFLDNALAAKMPLPDADKQALQLCLLRLCERDKDEDRALTVAKNLLDDGVRLAVDSENKERFNFVAVEILATVDELHLSRKPHGMPMLKRLIGIFMAVNNHNKAASAGAKLVDASLDMYGDASLETVVPINILADVYKAMGRYDLAEECYRQILEIQYKVYPSEHEEMVDVLLNLAQVCKLQKDVGEAEIFLESAVEMCLSVFDKHAEDGHADDHNNESSNDVEGRKKALMARAEALKGQLSHA
jgi:tetratricopeptide (TPR) repeat protein